MPRLLVLALLPVALFAGSGAVNLSLSYTPADFVFDKADGYDVVALPGQYSTAEPGSPDLPLAAYNVLIPPDAEVTGVDVVNAVYSTLPGEFNIHPSQRPCAFSRPRPAFVPPDPAAYASAGEYPVPVASCTPSGLAGGYRLAGIQVAPLQYLPARKQLRLATHIELRVRYETGRHEVLSLDASQVDLMAGDAGRLALNPDKVKSWAPTARQSDDWLCDMMVLTSSSMAASFQPFVDWKTRRGYKTVVVTTESIYATYPGRDNPEKIRNCIIDYWRNHGLKWVLLGGDDQIVPVRTAYLTVEGNTEEIATDMYYADLEYSWDSNHNNEFGEMDDSMSFFYDVFVGRAPVDNGADVQNFFAKCTTYERHPDSSYIKKVLYGSTMLFDPYHGKVINHMIAELFPTGWEQAHLEDPNYGVYAESLSAGFQLSHVAAHGNPTTFSVLDISEVPGLTNGLRRLNFVNSIACESGWFDGQECLAEALVNCTTGGCIATMLNSRYGFGYPPGFGPSEMLDLQFYRDFVRGDGSQFGTLCGMSKEWYQSLCMGQEVWRWCVYELNLFGDPTLSLWSEPPAVLTVTCPDTVLQGPQMFRVTVKNGTTPLAGALVCLSRPGETYDRGWTNSQGWVDLYVVPRSVGDVSLSVSARDCYPYETPVPVRGSTSGPALEFAGLRIDDSDGNGRLDPGETANLFVRLVNRGANAATGVTATLRTACPYLALVDSTSSYGTILPGSAVEGDAFRVTASPSTPPGTRAELVAAAAAGEGAWDAFFTTDIGAAPPAGRLWADHDTGNMILSVTSVGSIGTLGPYREGSGLKYPRNASNGSLYFTSLACGNGPGYVVDRWYGHPTSTYQTDWRILDTLRPVLPPIGADEEYHAVFDDGAHPAPRGLTVTQWSGAMAAPGYRDFVIIQYTLENRGASAIDGLYVGVLSDFDVNNTTDNNVYSDAGRRLVYMTQSSSEDNSAGIKLLSPPSAANLSAIDHAVYVTPGAMMTEAVKDSFLRGAIHVPGSNRVANWSCVASAGPFDLAPGGRTKVAFAMVGGNSSAEMLEHADSAQSWYDHKMPAGLSYLKSVIDDPAPGGNGDGIINPGESINLPTWVVNRSDHGALGVRAVLRRTSSDTLVTVTDSVRYLGACGSGDSAFTGPDGFKFRVAPSCTNNYPLPFALVCVDTLDSVYTSHPGLRVGAPQLVPGDVQCWDPQPGGNNNHRLDPGENAEVAIGLGNIGMENVGGVTAVLVSGDPRLTVLDSTGSYGTINRDTVVFNSTDRFRVVAASSIPPETQVSCTLRVTGAGYSAVRAFGLAVGVITTVDPIPDGPRTPALYWAYDDVDSGYTEAPDFSWLEVAGIGTQLSLGDDQTQTITLPAAFGPFRFYGQDYGQVSVCSNGFVAPGSSTASNYTNDQLPDATMPPVLAPFWDDLDPSSAGTVSYYHDAANHRFIVEWESVPHWGTSTYETFEAVLYDTTRAAADGNCEFAYQYLVAQQVDGITVGEQDPSQTVAIQALYDASYTRGAAPVTAGRAVKFTTDAPRTAVAENGGAAALRPALHAAPNPVRDGALVRFLLPADGRTRLAVLDVTGRVVRMLVDGRLARGEYSVRWDGRDGSGRTVSNGVYLYRLETGAGVVNRKAVVLR